MVFDVLVAVFAICGQVCHIVKKRTEEGKSEISVFKRWVLARPFNTLVASIAAIVAAHAVQADGATVIQAIGSSFMAGFAANSLANRPGANATRNS